MNKGKACELSHKNKSKVKSKTFKVVYHYLVSGKKMGSKDELKCKVYAGKKLCVRPKTPGVVPGVLFLAGGGSAWE